MLDSLLIQPLDLSHYWQYFILKTIIIAASSLLICFFSMKRFLKFINEKDICRQPIRKSGPRTHLEEKKNTPTMGGLIIVLSTFAATFLWVDISNNFVIATLVIFSSFSLIGFIDDYMKIKGKSSEGFKGCYKIVIQFAIVGLTLMILQHTNSLYLKNEVAIPFSDLKVSLGNIYILFAVIVVVGSGNATNLTDGLDGLISIPAIISLICLSIIAYCTSNYEITQKIGIDFIESSSDISYLCTALIGSIIAFLKYNLKPAKIFMGDVGSLGIGATLGIMAIILKVELVFFLIALLFVIEAVSVILQVGSYKIRKKRIFLMAPIHHHFEKMGWKETKVVKTFWFSSLIFALIGMAGFII